MTITIANNIYNQGIKIDEINWEDFCATVQNPPTAANKGQCPMIWGKCDFKLTEARRNDTGAIMYKKDGTPIMTAEKDSRKVIDRCALTYDFDELTEWDYYKIIETVQMFYLKAALYSTYSYNPGGNQYRFRLIIPLDEPVGPRAYTLLMQAFASKFKPLQFDKSAFKPNQWQFGPVKPAGGHYDYKIFNGENFCAESWLQAIDDNPQMFGMPAKKQVESVTEKTEKTETVNKINKQKTDYLDIYDDGDPRNKNNIIGAFCRVYSISEAIEEFDLPYEQISEDLYKYTGSTSGIPGAHTKADGTLFYSYHNSDPAYGKSDLNSFDLVKLIKYDDSRDSYLEMVEFARSIPEVAEEERRFCKLKKIS